MELKEKFQDIFQRLSIDDEIEVLSLIEPETLDSILLFEHGNKILTGKAASTEIETLVKIFSLKFKEKWNILLNSILESIEGLKEYSEITQETIDDKANINLERLNENKVSAFNSNELEDKASDTYGEIAENTNERIREHKVKRLKTANFYENFIKYVDNHNIYDIMIKDIVQTVSKLIY